jgi:mono/diheme cytochrome c family protein
MTKRQCIERFLILSLASAALVVAPCARSVVGAQEFGDARRGAALANGICVACHGVRKGETSVNPLAPPFSTVADVRGMSAMALNVALQSSHRNMPNFVLDAEERADLVSYILSLKSK